MDEFIQNYETSSSNDCFQCKMVGASGSFGIGCYLVYNSFMGPYNSIARRLLLRSMAGGAFYISIARLIYFPPFSSLSTKMRQFSDEMVSASKETTKAEDS